MKNPLAKRIIWDILFKRSCLFVEKKSQKISPGKVSTKVNQSSQPTTTSRKTLQEGTDNVSRTKTNAQIWPRYLSNIMRIKLHLDGQRLLLVFFFNVSTQLSQPVFVHSPWFPPVMMQFSHACLGSVSTTAGLPQRQRGFGCTHEQPDEVWRMTKLPFNWFLSQ